jgi:hypothetical protein
MSSDCVDALTRYLKGGDRASYGDGKDPFKKFSGGGGVEGLAKALAADVDGVEDCPDGEERQAAMMFGLIVAGAKCLNPKDIVMIRVFMELAYEDYTTSFKTGMSLGKESTRAEEPVGGAHGGQVPSKAEADKILAEKGMRWEEVVAVTSVMHNGSVPSDSDIAHAGYGSDPGQWSSAKESRKNGKPNMNHFIKTKDSKGYREMLVKGASHGVRTRGRGRRVDDELHSPPVVGRATGLRQVARVPGL